MRATILFAHGSRDPQWNQSLLAVAGRMRAIDPASRVSCAYLEFMSPDLATAAQACVADGCDEIVVVPMFLGAGHHVRQDLPSLVAGLGQQLVGVRVRLQTLVGEDPRVVEVLARVALD